ncbi:MAG: hypothetical protein ACK5ME_14040 [Parahaliea sp.]
MSTALLEIVDLGDGEIVLQRVEDDSEPLVRIHFSQESRMYLMENTLEVAKAMIQAGLQTASALNEQSDKAEAEQTESDEASADMSPPPRVLH